jgi:PTH2 family peptidyl-tRNA hydrolase
MTDRLTKQVIVIRKDLKMRRGKEIAQGAHASMGALWAIEQQALDSGPDRRFYPDDVFEAALAWKNGVFTKVCVTVDSEIELLALLEQAKAAHLPHKLITDNGKTEFHGVPTNTCIAIGPGWADEIDKITGHLKLY